MKTLHLVLKSKWYDMIESGVKTEEYRKIKPYWIKRLCINCPYYGNMRCKYCSAHRYDECQRHFDKVCFHKGYSNTTMTYQIEYIFVGNGKPEWGAPTIDNVFIIKLGRRIG